MKEESTFQVVCGGDRSTVHPLDKKGDVIGPEVAPLFFRVASGHSACGPPCFVLSTFNSLLAIVDVGDSSLQYLKSDRQMKGVTN